MLPAQHAGQLLGDRQPQPGAAVLAAGGAVGLLERLEDHLQLAVGDADAGVAHRERDDHRRRVQRRHAVHGARRHRRHLEGDVPGVGELHRVRQQVAQHLLQPLRVGGDRPAAASGATSTRSSRPFSSACGPIACSIVAAHLGQLDGRRRRRRPGRPRSWRGRGCRRSAAAGPSPRRGWCWRTRSAWR